MKFSVNDRVIWCDPFQKKEVKATILKANGQNCRILTANFEKMTVPVSELRRVQEHIVESCLDKDESCLDKDESCLDKGESCLDKDKLSIINSFCEKAVEAIELDLQEIRTDGGTQQRLKLDLNHVKSLEEQLEEGQKLEPITCFYDGKSYWLADGFHRLAAHKNHSEPTIAAHIKEGTRREAVLYSVGVNADYKPCLPRSNADKRRAVETLLNDPEWSQWSDREISRQCRVSDRLVNIVRKSICEYSQIEKSETKKVARNGKSYEMRTGNIGEAQTPQQPEGNEISKENLTSGSDCPKLDPKPISIDTQEILIGFISNIEEMTKEQLKAAYQAIIKRFTALNKEAECQSDLSQKAS